jgi:tetratricopeptide (TPR) repeat protein
MLEEAKAVCTAAPRKFTARRPTIILALVCSLLAPAGAWAQGNNRVEQLERAAAMIGSNQLAEAERLLNQVLKVAPDEAAALNLMGALRAKQGRLDEAETLFTRAVRSNAALAGAHMNLAHLYLLKREPEKTASELKEVLRLEPGNAEAGYRLAWLLLSQGRVDECIELVERLKTSQQPSAPLLGVVASAYLKKGNKEGAVSALKRAVELSPNEAAYHFALGVAWLKHPPNLEEARLSLSQSLKLRPDDAQAQLLLGYVLLRQKQYTEARALLEKNVEKGAGTPEAFYYLGLIAQGQNEDARAVEFFEKSIRLDPSFAHSHIALGASYLKLKDYERARQALETGVKLSPEDPKAHYNLAMLYARMKIPERAQEEMRIVEKMKKEDRSRGGEDDIVAPQQPQQR